MTNANMKTGTMADLLAALDNGPKTPRYMMRRAGDVSEVSTIFNTWATVGSAKHQAKGAAELNPGVAFEVVDLQTGEVVA